jgi:hypothetical protein
MPAAGIAAVDTNKYRRDETVRYDACCFLGDNLGSQQQDRTTQLNGGISVC